MAWVFDTHPADSRVVGPVKVAGCVVARYGTGGGNTPMVVDVLCRASTQGGAESQMNTATTLTTDHSMKSANPHSGCREVDTAKTLDCGTPDPNRNQGGIAIIQKGNEHERMAEAK